MKKLFATLIMFVFVASIVYAHNGMEHVMGTVASISDDSITVTTSDGKSQTVMTTADTKYTKMDMMMTMKDIKVGDRVAIHATRKGDQLTAAEVKVGAMKMKDMSEKTGEMKTNK